MVGFSGKSIIESTEWITVMYPERDSMRKRLICIFLIKFIVQCVEALIKI